MNRVPDVSPTVAAMMIDPEGAGRRPLPLRVLCAGDKFVYRLRHDHDYGACSLCSASRLAWRRLVRHAHPHPWLLAQAFGMRRAEPGRRTTVQRRVGAEVCCVRL